MKKLSIIALVIILLLSMTTMVNAKEELSYTLEISADKTEIEPGDTVKIDFKINDLKLSTGAIGVSYFECHFVYDSDVFEGVTFTGASDRGGTYVVSDHTTSLITENGSIIFSATLKVKQDANFETTDVGFSDYNVVDNIDEIRRNR